MLASCFYHNTRVYKVCTIPSGLLIETWFHTLVDDRRDGEEGLFLDACILNNPLDN